MLKIYSHAVNVLVWLGEDANNSELLVPYVDSYVNERNRKVDWDELYDHYQHPQTVIKARNSLLQRPYWNRKWIIQELLAQHVIFYCGGFQLDGEQFETLWQLRDGPIYDYERHVMTLTERHLTHRRETDMSPNLCQFLSTFSRTECMENLDTVYALLGMPSEKDPMKALEIDYNISNTTPYLRVTDPWRRWFTSDRLEIEAAEKLRRALELEWPALFAYMDAEESPGQGVDHLLLTRGFKINDIDEGTEYLPIFTIEIPDG
jgi:hypothetical protein